MSRSVGGTANSCDPCKLSASAHHLYDSGSLQRLPMDVDQHAVRGDVGSFPADVTPRQAFAYVHEENALSLAPSPLTFGRPHRGQCPESAGEQALLP